MVSVEEGNRQNTVAIEMPRNHVGNTYAIVASILTANHSNRIPLSSNEKLDKFINELDQVNKNPHAEYSTDRSIVLNALTDGFAATNRDHITNTDVVTRMADLDKYKLDQDL